jgi:hypothetical protein
MATLALIFPPSLSRYISAQSEPEDKLESAISVLRHIDPDKLGEKEKDAKGKEIDKAWEVIRAAGKTGIQRLKQEIQRIDASNERDDFFKLNASSLLWQIARFDEAKTIAEVWNSTPLQAQYMYVFDTGMSAAVTQDPRVLPMLEACLRDDQGKLFIWLHSLDVRWPLTHEFLWGAYGPKGLPVLARILETSNNSVELQSAMILLANDQYLPALSAIRKLATNRNADVRRAAIRSLGQFGHPQDYDFLASRLESSDPQELFHVAFALYEYEDLRAVPLLIRLLNSEDDHFRGEVMATLLHLTSDASIQAVERHCSAAKSESERKACSSLVDAFEEQGISLANFERKPESEKNRLIARLRSKQAEEFQMAAADKTPTREELSAALAEWKKNSRPKSDKYSWIEARHIIAAAAPDTLDMLLEAKASFYGRVSDECLSDVRDVRVIIRWIGRSRYRKNAGLTERVEAR